MSNEGRPPRVPLVVLLVVSMAATFVPPAARAQDRADAVQALLDRRAAAVRDRDRDAFLATISPLAPDDFRARQAAAFDHLGAVPVASYSLTARWDVYGDLARPRDEKRHARADDVAIPVTQERLKIRGYDASPAVEDLYLTFLLHEGEWGIAADDDLEGLALLSARRIWEFGPVQTSANEHFILLRHPGRSAPPDTLALAEEALGVVDEHWGGKWTGKVPIVVPSDEAELQRMLQITVDLSDFVAFAYSNVDDRRDVHFSGTRILLNPEAIGGRSRSSTFGVLAHELAHAAALRRSGPFMPLWVEEGLAEQVRHRGDAGALSFLRSRAAELDDRLPTDVEFQFGDSDDILLAYQEAYSAVRFFVDRYGLGTFRRFYARLGSARDTFGTQRYHLNRALRATAGTSLRKFERAWAGSIDSL